MNNQRSFTGSTEIWVFDAVLYFYLFFLLSNSDLLFFSSFFLLISASNVKMSKADGCDSVHRLAFSFLTLLLLRECDAHIVRAPGWLSRAWFEKHSDSLLLLMFVWNLHCFKIHAITVLTRHELSAAAGASERAERVHFSRGSFYRQSAVTSPSRRNRGDYCGMI